VDRDRDIVTPVTVVVGPIVFVLLMSRHAVVVRGLGRLVEFVGCGRVESGSSDAVGVGSCLVAQREKVTMPSEARARPFWPSF
jgi:hypothetical protein